MECGNAEILYSLGGKAIDSSLMEILSQRYSIKGVSMDQEFIANVGELRGFLVLLDLTLPQNRGLEILKILRKFDGEIRVVALTLEKKVEEAIQVIRMGALDYLHPKKDLNRLLEVLQRPGGRPDRIETLDNKMEEKDIPIGESLEFRKILQVIHRIAASPTTVLLHGESGTGKEVMARLIHRKSQVSQRPFITVNLPSIPGNLVESVLFGHEKGSFTSAYQRHRGKFELADGGTIFLDEIGDLHLDVQSKLLRVIQEGEIERIGGCHPIKVHVRLIAATKKDLNLAVKKGEFRDDLFYRLHVIPISLPPLRKRKEDIPGLCHFFIDRYAAKLGKKVKSISDAALKALHAYRWPGNVRELENLIERIMALVEPDQEGIVFEDIPLEYVFSNFSESTPNAHDLDGALIQYEKNLILKALGQNNWNRKQTAKALGITYGILKYKIRKLDIHLPGRSRSPLSPISPFSSKTP